MSALAITSIILGLAIVATRLPGVVTPSRHRAWALRFPRSRLWGRILMAVATGWAWIYLYQAATEEWTWARPIVITGVPIAYWLIIEYADQFLAVRALAALVLLVAKVLVDMADSSDSSWRLVITVTAYLAVVASVWMTVAPHHVRDVIQYFAANDTRWRWACGAGVVVGAFFLALGLFVY